MVVGSAVPKRTPGIILTSDKGRIYCVNLQTRETSWDPPSQAAAELPQATEAGEHGVKSAQPPWQRARSRRLLPSTRQYIATLLHATYEHKLTKRAKDRHTNTTTAHQGRGAPDLLVCPPPPSPLPPPLPPPDSSPDPPRSPVVVPFVLFMLLPGAGMVGAGSITCSAATEDSCSSFEHTHMVAFAKWRWSWWRVPFKGPRNAQKSP